VSSSVEISRVDPLGKGDVKDDFSKEGRIVEDMLSRLRRRLDTLDYEDQVAPLRKYMHIHHHTGDQPSQQHMSTSLIRDRAEFPKSITAGEESGRGMTAHTHGSDDDGAHLLLSSDDEFGPQDDMFVDSLGDLGMQSEKMQVKEHFVCGPRGDVDVVHDDDDISGEQTMLTHPTGFIGQRTAWSDDSEHFASRFGERTASPSRAVC
jgi:hypothetical protein